MKHIITTTLSSILDLQAKEDEISKKKKKKLAGELRLRELQASVEAVIYNHLGGYLKQDL